MPSSSLKSFSSAAARFIRRHAALAIAALALIAHLHFFIVAGDTHERWDSSQYLACAKSLAAGRGFLDANGTIDARRTPGYPAFLAGFAPLRFDETAIAIVQHLLAIGLVVALFFATRALTGDASVAAIASALLAVDSGQIYMANLVMAETLMSITLFAAVICLARGRVAAAGILTGITALIRPIAMYLWLPLAIWIALGTARNARRRVRAVLLFVICAWSLPALWMWRNDERAGVASLSSIQGEILYYWRAAGIVAMQRSGFEYSPLPFSGEESFRYQFFRVAQHEFAANAERMFHGRHLTEAEISDREGRIARDIIRRHPRELVLLTIYGALHLVFDSTWDYAGTISGGWMPIVLIWCLLIVAVASFILAVVGFVRLLRLDARLAWLLAIVLLYFVAVSSGPEHEQWRYRVPLIPLYSILIGCCIIRGHAGLLRTESR